MRLLALLLFSCLLVSIPPTLCGDRAPVWVFYNTVTHESQFEEPGGDSCSAAPGLHLRELIHTPVTQSSADLPYVFIYRCPIH